MVPTGLILVLGLFAAAQPSPRGYVDMVYVPSAGKVLVFGGQASPVPPRAAVGGTWWWDPSDGTWTEVTSEPQPSPRSAAHLELHGASGTVVLFGGGDVTEAGYSTFSETWVFEPATESWSQVAFDGPTPEAAIGEQFAYHEAADVFVLFGGLRLGSGYLRDTWHLDLEARAWTQVQPTRRPFARNYNAFAYDPIRQLLVMSGGVDGAVDETWTYDPRDTTWTLVERRSAARAVHYARIVWDAETETMVRIGGEGLGSGPIWSYDLGTNTWSELLPDGDAPHVSRHAAAYVPGSGVVVFGGLPDRTDTFTDALWILDPAARSWRTP